MENSTSSLPSNILDSIRNKKYKKKIVLVDGYNLFMRTFTTINQFDKQMRHIGALQGFLSTLGSLAQKNSYVIVCWDGEDSGEWRRNIFPEYKQGRRGKFSYMAGMEDLFDGNYDKTNAEEIIKANFEYQYKIIQTILEHIPIFNLFIYGLEADDLIAYFCTHAPYNNHDITVYSSDKDFQQLLKTDGSVKIETKMNTYIRYEDARKKLALLPENFSIARAIVGDDKGDGIVGIKGIGFKTLLKHFPELAVREMSIDEFKYLVDEKKDSHKLLKSLYDSFEHVEKMFKIINLRQVNFKSHHYRQINYIMEQAVNIHYTAAAALIMREAQFDTNQYQRIITNVASLEKNINKLLG